MIKCKECGKEVKRNAAFCPHCGAQLKKKSMILFFIRMVVIFFFVFEVAIAGILLSGASNAITYSKYGTEFVLEGIMALLILVVMLLFGNAYVFKEKKEKFIDSIKLGWPMLTIAAVSFIVNVVATRNKEIDPNALINLIVYCFTIGVAEEFLCRGWLQNEFTERFNKDKTSIIKSIIFASLVFGLMHITNIWSTEQGVFLTIMQIIQAVSSGFFLGSIYYKTKNIWSVVFIHGFYDFSLFLAELPNLRDCQAGVYNNPMLIYQTISSLLIIGMYILGGILALRSKTGIKLIEETEQTKKQNKIFIGIILAILILILIPLHIDGQDEATICFTYEEKEVDTGYEKSFMFLVDPKYELVSDENYCEDECEEEQNPTVINIYVEKNQFGVFEDIILENGNGDKVKLDFNVRDFVVYENNDYYGILIDESSVNTTVYYAKVYKSQITNDKEALENIKESFVSYDLPLIKDMGYMKMIGADEKLPYMKTETYEAFMIDTDGKLYRIVINY